MCVTVTIYERLNGKWKRVPSRLSPQEVRRAGQFYMTWYVQRRKRFEPCVATTVGEAVLEAKQKELALSIASLPITPFASSTKIARVDGNTAIPEAITAYLAAYKNEARRPKTYKAHELALNEFKGWTDRKRVNQIDRDHLFAWKSHLESRGEDPNDPLTAAWKLLRVNKFIKKTMRLRNGEGPLKKSDLGKELNRKPKVEVYAKESIEAFLAACRNPLERVLFTLFFKVGLRKQEMMFLEWSDLDIKAQKLFIHRKTLELRDCDGTVHKYVFVPKNGQDDEVVFPKSMISDLEALKSVGQFSFCFPTRYGLPDWHLLDKCKAIARRAGLPGNWKLKTWRATFATNRLRAGYTVPDVREALRHKGMESVEHYLAYLKAEEMRDSGMVDKGW